MSGGRRRSLIAALLLSSGLTSCSGTDGATTVAPDRQDSDASTSISTSISTSTTAAAAAAPTTTPPTEPPTAAPPTTAAPVAATELPADADLLADPPDPASTAPGDLLRYQRITTPLGGLLVPNDLWRVMYTSTDTNGSPILVTGLVRVPMDRPAPPNGRPVVTWAHGTTGTADTCSPSRRLDAPPVPDPFVNDGFVVAATDYAGLGTPGPHPYFDGASAGRAVLDIVTAAGHLPGVTIAPQFAIWGHSQGGHAALFARELAAQRLPAHQLIGTVALAPPSLVKDTMTAILVALQPKGFAAMTVAGIAATHPDAELTDILIPAAAEAIGTLVETECAAGIDRALGLFGNTDIVVANPNQIEPWATYLQAAEPAMAAGAGPLLLIHSIDDRTVPAFMSAVVEMRTCSRGEPTVRWVLGSGGHNGIIGLTFDLDRQWTLDRFAGVPAPSNCASGG